MQKERISNGEELRKGDYLNSPDGDFKAIFQEDGNFVIYGPGGPCWSTNTHGGRAERVVMQDDLNLVIYWRNAALWSSGTNQEGSHKCSLYLANGGSLTIEKDDGSLVWQS